MGGYGKFSRWKISIHRPSSPKSDPNHKQQQPPPPPPPEEFICPICGSLLSDPVVVGSGQTFDRLCVDVCRDLGFIPTLPDGSTPDLSRTIPNLAFKSTIASWCSNTNSPLRPHPPDYSSIEKIVRRKKAESMDSFSMLIKPSERALVDAVGVKNPAVNMSPSVSELARRVNRFDLSSSSASSEESVIIGASPSIAPLPLATRPFCLSSFSSSSSENVDDSLLKGINTTCIESEEDEFVYGLRSSDAAKQEAAAAGLRKAAKSDENRRISLCTARILAALLHPLASAYRGVRTNAAAAVVNLSLEKANKVAILRSGIVPPLIELLKSGGGDDRLDEFVGRSIGGIGVEDLEAQEHAAGAIFSLSLEDGNKAAIGFLGALPPLLHCLRSSAGNERTRHDSALALYHLSLVQTNRSKLVKIGAIPTLLTMLQPWPRKEEGGQGLAGKVLLVLCNLALEGRAVMLDANAVEILVGIMRRGEFESESIRENCVAALYALSRKSSRFKGLAREAGAVEVLRAVVEGRGSGSDRAKDKARRILIGLKVGGESVGGASVVDWEGILNNDDSGPKQTNWYVGGRSIDGSNSSDF